MARYASFFIALAAFLTLGLGTAMSFAAEIVSAEKKNRRIRRT